MKKFKVGDVVLLKAGSPLMTVTHVYEGNYNDICCDVIWYDETKSGFKKDEFNQELLSKND